MPTWGQLIAEINQALAQHGPAGFDFVRRKYMVLLHQKTGRNVILYATKWTQPGTAEPGLVSITMEDVEALMEVVHGLDGSKGLDLIVHSPGGSPDAAEAVVHYLRSKFDDIRVVVPHAAMSAATMLACASDKIVMGKHSALGPIDPQFIIAGPAGAMAHPAQAILDQFEKAQEQCKDPALLGAWVPILPQYGPSLLVQCENALKLAQELVAEWLTRWMFKGDAQGSAKAQDIAKRLADHSAFKSHGRPIHRDAAIAMGLKVEALETDQVFQAMVLSIYHASSHTFSSTPAVKIVENQLGRAFLKSQQQVLMVGPPVPPGARPPGPPGVPRPPALSDPPAPMPGPPRP
jgi:ATP-dependent protease ClpP protease subunit